MRNQWNPLEQIWAFFHAGPFPRVFTRRHHDRLPTAKMPCFCYAAPLRALFSVTARHFWLMRTFLVFSINMKLASFVHWYLEGEHKIVSATSGLPIRSIFPLFLRHSCVIPGSRKCPTDVWTVWTHLSDTWIKDQHMASSTFWVVDQTWYDNQTRNIRKVTRIDRAFLAILWSKCLIRVCSTRKTKYASAWWF